MTWRASFTSAVAVARRLASVSARPSVTPTGAVSGPAESIAPSPATGTAKPTTPDLTARAVRTCNRKPEAVEAYLRLHRTLGMGA